MITPKVITGPTTEPISATEAKLHCRIDTSADDTLVAQYIKAARKLIEKATGRTIHQQTLEWHLDAFPSESYIVLPRATPLISITSITYKDSDATVNTMSASEYIADTDTMPGRVVLAYNASWPSFTAYPVNPIKVRYTAGIATASPVTECGEDIKIPMYLLTAHLYENKELASEQELSEIPLGIRMWIDHLVTEYVF